MIRAHGIRYSITQDNAYIDQEIISDITMTVFLSFFSPAVYLLPRSSCCAVCRWTVWSGANRTGGFKGGPAAIRQSSAGVIYELIYTFCDNKLVIAWWEEGDAYEILFLTLYFNYRMASLRSRLESYLLTRQGKVRDMWESKGKKWL